MLRKTGRRRLTFWCALGLAVSLAACAGPDREPKPIYSYTVTSPTTLGVLVDECQVDPQVVSLVEDESSVRIRLDGVHHQGSAPACSGTPVDVTLDGELNDRTVVDDVTGRPVRREG